MYLPKRSSQNCDLQFANIDRLKENCSIDLILYSQLQVGGIIGGGDMDKTRLGQNPSRTGVLEGFCPRGVCPTPGIIRNINLLKTKHLGIT